MITKALEQNGAKVYIIGRRKEVLERVAKEEAVSTSRFPEAWGLQTLEGLSDSLS